MAASSDDRNFCYIPKDIAFTPDAVYAHITSNNTIKGTQWAEFPDTGAVPLVADMSSDMLSRPIPVERFGLIYAGAQKNIGPAGVLPGDQSARTCWHARPRPFPPCCATTPTRTKIRCTTPRPCFTVYIIQLVLKWLEETVGGLARMDELNRRKAGLLYQAIDSSDFYRATADADSRSLMNVTFRLPSEELEKKFVADALAHGLGGLKGHRSVGGCRASIYNATGMDAIEALADFMKDFEKRNGVNESPGLKSSFNSGLAP